MNRPNEYIDETDSEEPEEWEDDDSDDHNEMLPCPECKQLIYEDAEQCPHCGQYVMPLAHSARSKSWMTIVVVLAILAAFALMTLS